MRCASCLCRIPSARRTRSRSSRGTAAPPCAPPSLLSVRAQLPPRAHSTVDKQRAPLASSLCHFQRACHFKMRARVTKVLRTEPSVRLWTTCVCEYLHRPGYNPCVVCQHSSPLHPSPPLTGRHQSSACSTSYRCAWSRARRRRRRRCPCRPRRRDRRVSCRAHGASMHGAWGSWHLRQVVSSFIVNIVFVCLNPVLDDVFYNHGSRAQHRPCVRVHSVSAAPSPALSHPRSLISPNASSVLCVVQAPAPTHRSSTVYSR